MSYGKTETVLIVGEEPELAMRYASWLEDVYEVYTAHTREVVLERLAETDIDVILFDGPDQREEAEDQLKALAETVDDCRLALITGKHPTPEIFDHPVDDYLVKPIRSDELRDLVDFLLRLSDYDELVQESFSIASKLRVLSDGNGSSERTKGDEYRELRRRLKRLRGQMDQSIGAFDDREIGHIYRDIGTPESSSN